MAVLSEEKKHVLFLVSLNGGSIGDEVLRQNLEKRGPFVRHGSEPQYVKQWIERTIDTLKKNNILLERTLGEKPFLSIDDSNLLQHIGGDKEDINFYQTLQAIQREIAEKRVFFVEESDISSISAPQEILDELRTAYTLFVNAENPKDYALVMVPCRRATEELIKRLKEKHGLKTLDTAALVKEVFSKSEDREAKAIAGGIYAIHIKGSREGAHTGKNPDKIDAFSCLLATIMITKLAEEAKLFETNEDNSN